MVRGGGKTKKRTEEREGERERARETSFLMNVSLANGDGNATNARVVT